MSVGVTKIKANASMDQNRSYRDLVTEILREAQETDRHEDELYSVVWLSARVARSALRRPSRTPRLPIAKHHLRLWLPLCEPERAPRQQSEQTIAADELRRSAGPLGRLLHL